MTHDFAFGLGELLAQSIGWLKMSNARWTDGFRGIFDYLHDFLIVSPYHAESDFAFTIPCELLLGLGFQISPSKMVPPWEQATYLGIVFDICTIELSLPQTKLEETSLLISSFLGRKRASKHRLQQIAGKLSWAYCVIHKERTFLRCILDSLNSLCKVSAKFRFTPDMLKDLFWWQRFLAVFNSKRLYHSKVPIADFECSCICSWFSLSNHSICIIGLIHKDFELPNPSHGAL